MDDKQILDLYWERSKLLYPKLQKIRKVLQIHSL